MHSRTKRPLAPTSSTTLGCANSAMHWAYTAPPVAWNASKTALPLAARRKAASTSTSQSPTRASASLVVPTAAVFCSNTVCTQRATAATTASCTLPMTAFDSLALWNDAARTSNATKWSRKTAAPLSLVICASQLACNACKTTFSN